jgi:CheY-like chemotaxis protein
MKGRLEVTSEQGVGSDFRLYLPVKLSHQDLRLDTESEYDAPVTGIAGGKTFTVHVVDDVFENRALLRALLEPLGFVCIEAENGLQALERLEEKLPDLILMDIVMPEMDGREAVRIIRTRPDCKDLPIVAITASGFEDERKALLSLGFTAYLRKPFIDRDLYEIIARMLNITWVFAKDAETGNGLDSQIDIMEYVAKTISKAEDNPALATLREAIETVDLNQLIDVLQHIQLPEPILNRLLKEAKAANFRFFMDLQERIDEGA